jgi:thymidylate synthase (FAD)
VSDIVLKRDIDVELVHACGVDATVVMAARASTKGMNAQAEECYGLISAMSREGHNSPFEHNFMTVRAHQPAAVWWEWVRHRFHAVDVPGLSFSLESGRYKKLEPVFWEPRPSRGMRPAAGHKPIRPKYDPVEPEQFPEVMDDLRAGYEGAWKAYTHLLGRGVCNEVARNVLGFGVYYAGFVSSNLLGWLHFLAKRTHEPRAKRVSYPLAEIEESARQVEALLRGLWPLVMRAFDENGREAP